MNNKMQAESALSSGSAANTQATLAGGAEVPAAADGAAAAPYRGGERPPPCCGGCLAVTRAASIYAYGTANN